ncbi:MucB/RseB C-terminal domain-containing protein [Kushneria aurantia]|uniref:MucB/RseB C-terminal domain-containing protein n=1 Tax=Kushneria aurantia TaxID=504092 RepID=A0ABV6G6Y2_9GAMM|nr:MucB/RseB C-terminal domain-containing protein [Kushneria aurantia]
MRQWFCISLVSVALLASVPPVSASQEEASVGEGEADTSIDCQQLDQQPEDSAKAWFRRSLVAQHCYGFQAVGLRLGMGSLRTFLVEQRVDADGHEKQHIQYLDGRAESIDEHGGQSAPWWIGGAGDHHPASINATVDRLAELYDFQMVARDVVAGRQALVLDIQPRDDQRFPHRLWVDLASGLPLRQQLLDGNGQAMDTVQIVRLDSLVRIEGSVDIGSSADQAAMTSMGWQPQWLPQGFYRQPAQSSVELGGVEVERQLYSDGLATLSIFIAPVSESVALREGVHRLGNFRAAARRAEHGGGEHQIIAVGAIPAGVLSRVVAGVDWR